MRTKLHYRRDGLRTFRWSHVVIASCSETFREKKGNCIKVVIKPSSQSSK